MLFLHSFGSVILWEWVRTMELLVQFLGKFNKSRIMSEGGEGECPRRYTWVDGCKAVEFDDVREWVIEKVPHVGDKGRKKKKKRPRNRRNLRKRKLQTMRRDSVSTRATTHLTIRWIYSNGLRDHQLVVINLFILLTIIFTNHSYYYVLRTYRIIRLWTGWKNSFYVIKYWKKSDQLLAKYEFFVINY